MQEHWEKVGDELTAVKEQIEALLEMVPQSQKFYTATANINKQWKKLQHAVNEMDPFITPVKSVAVTSALLAHEALAAAWTLWKEYLVEQHGLHLRSRAELMALKRLSEISGAKPDVAVRYLEFAMSRADKNFYVVNEQALPEPATTTQQGGKTVIKLPAQYSPTPSLPVGEGAKASSPVAAAKPANGFNLKDEVEKFKSSRKTGVGSRK
jgi:hypothetical protein